MLLFKLFGILSPNKVIRPKLRASALSKIVRQTHRQTDNKAPFLPFRDIKNALKSQSFVTDRPTDGPTDRPTYTVAYRVACTRLKRSRKKNYLVNNEIFKFLRCGLDGLVLDMTAIASKFSLARCPIFDGEGEEEEKAEQEKEE